MAGLILAKLLLRLNQMLYSRASEEKFPEGPTEKTINSKKRLKNSPIKPFPGGGTTKKKDRKIALLSLYVLYLCHF